MSLYVTILVLDLIFNWYPQHLVIQKDNPDAPTPEGIDTASTKTEDVRLLMHKLYEIYNSISLEISG
jgi:hypothetical protein